ncbi:MAG: SPOR domain-containing protein [Vicinamibacteria bacterium]
MTEPQDDYYYEIQLNNKQLVFYFLAGATALVLSFLAGVMVGRGVDNGASETQAARPVQEERIVPEETPRPSPPAAEELTYAQRLEGDRPEDSLERPRPGAAATRTTPAPATTTKAAAPPPTAPTAAPRATATPAPTPRSTATPRPSPSARTADAGKPPAGTFSIQVGAFNKRSAADSVVGRLKKKGYEAFIVTRADGLFNVWVGRFPARADAERVQAKLRDEEKFKPFIVKN